MSERDESSDGRPLNGSPLKYGRALSLIEELKAAEAAIKIIEESSSMNALLSTVGSTQAALAKFEQRPSMKALLSTVGLTQTALARLEQSPSMKAMLSTVGSTQTALAKFEQSPSMKALLSTVGSTQTALARLEQSPSMKALHSTVGSTQTALARLEQSPSMKAMLSTVGSTQTALARLEQSPSMKALLSTVGSTQTALARLEQSPSMKAMLSTVGSTQTALAQLGQSPSMKAMLAQANAFAKSSAMKALTGSDSSLAPEKWGLSITTTFNEVVQEFVGRFTNSQGAPADLSGLIQLGTDAQSSLEVSDSYQGEVVPPAPSKTPMEQVPTWIMLIWVVLGWTFMHWDSVRSNLVDLNARLPETELFADVRTFIRTEMAGKPGDFRLVTGTNVALRYEPGMKSGVILHMPKDAVVVVHGKEDRNWRFVTYEHQGFLIDGYVSTRFLKKASR